MERRFEEKPSKFTISKGRAAKGGVRNYIIDRSAENAMTYLAVRTLIQGKQKKQKLEEALKEAVAELKETNPNFRGFWVLNRLHGVFSVNVDSVDEFQLSENWNKAFRTFGDYASGDEKLFRYTGYSGFVRLVKSKPAGLGLWHFQLCIRLGNGKPFCVFSCMHSSLDDNGRTMKCIDVVKEWANLVRERSGAVPCMLFMDSYYLTNDGRVMMRSMKVPYSASLNRGRFSTICNALGPKLVKSGTHVTAWNKRTKEAVTYKWSEDVNIGKKFVLGLGYEKREKKKGDDICAVYDHYKVGFYLCNGFNQVMHGKTWPCKSKGDLNSGFNYLYTTTLLNTHHLWMDADPANRMCVSFKSFCTGLAHEMAASI